MRNIFGLDSVIGMFPIYMSNAKRLPGWAGVWWEYWNHVQSCRATAAATAATVCCIVDNFLPVLPSGSMLEPSLKMDTVHLCSYGSIHGTLVCATVLCDVVILMNPAPIYFSLWEIVQMPWQHFSLSLFLFAALPISACVFNCLNVLLQQQQQQNKTELRHVFVVVLIQQCPVEAGGRRRVACGGCVFGRLVASLASLLLLSQSQSQSVCQPKLLLLLLPAVCVLHEALSLISLISRYAFALLLLPPAQQK